ncbi:hypothetical protein C8R46DRAFT_1040982 [Mycena filopes]|nr:hypothetical protein C8R46DRAFT_1040982 [Mycena filopes]
MDKIRASLQRTPEWRQARDAELKKVKAVIKDLKKLLDKLRADKTGIYTSTVAHFTSVYDNIPYQRVSAVRKKDPKAIIQLNLKWLRSPPGGYPWVAGVHRNQSVILSTRDIPAHWAGSSFTFYPASTSRARAQIAEWEEDPMPMIQANRRGPMFAQVDIDGLLGALDPEIILHGMTQVIASAHSRGGRNAPWAPPNTAQFEALLWNSIALNTEAQYQLSNSLRALISRLNPQAARQLLGQARSGLLQGANIEHLFLQRITYTDGQSVEAAQYYPNMSAATIFDAVQNVRPGDRRQLDGVLNRALLVPFLEAGLDVQHLAQLQPNMLTVFINGARQEVPERMRSEKPRAWIQGVYDVVIRMIIATQARSSAASTSSSGHSGHSSGRRSSNSYGSDRRLL